MVVGVRVVVVVRLAVDDDDRTGERRGGREGRARWAQHH